MKKIIVFLVILNFSNAWADDREAASKKVIYATGEIATGVFDKIIKPKLIDEQPAPATDDIPTIMENNLKDLLASLGDPFGKVHLKGNQNGVEKAKLRIDFPFIKPFAFRFREARTDDKPDFIPYITFGSNQINMRIAAEWNNGDIISSIRFFKLKKENEIEKKVQVRSPMDLKMDPLKGLNFQLEEITLVVKGLDKDSKELQMDMDCKVFERNNDQSQSATWSTIGKCSMDATYNKETKQWDSLEYEVFDDKGFDELEGINKN